MEYVWLAGEMFFVSDDLFGGPQAASLALNLDSADADLSAGRILSAAKNATKTLVDSISNVKKSLISSTQFQGMVKSTLASAALVHSRLLFPIGLAQLRKGNACNFERHLETYLRSLSNEALSIRLHISSGYFRKKGASRLKVDLHEAYAIFDSTVIRALKDYLGNARHAKRTAETDHWGTDNSSANTGKAMVWLLVEYDATSVCIGMVNSVKNLNLETIKREVRESLVSSDISTVDGAYECTAVEGYPEKVLMSLRIPFVHVRNYSTVA